MKIEDIYELIKESDIGKFSGAGIILTTGKTVLMLEKHNGCWGFPGGKPNEGEEAHETAKRETFEEIGSFSGKFITSIKLKNDNRIFYSFVYYTPKEFNITLSEEHKSYEWVNITKIKDKRLQKIVDRNLKKIIITLKNNS